MRKIFAIFFFIILVFPLLFAAQVSISVVSWALDRDYYTTILDQPVVHTALGADALIDQMLTASLHLPPEADTTALREILSSVLTPEYFRGQISNYVNSLFDYLQGKATEFYPVIDIKPLKQAITGDQQDAFLFALVQALPACAPGQTPGFGSDTATACKPAGIPDELIIEQALKPSLALMLSQVPDQAPLPGEFGAVGKDMGWRSYLPGMAAPASIMLSVLILSFIAAVAWYLIALIADTGWNGRLQWLGWMLLIPSLLVFLLGFAVQGGAAAYWINFGLERAQLSVLPSGLNLAEILQSVATASLPRVSDAFRMAGGIGGAFALVFIFWGIATPRTKSS